MPEDKHEDHSDKQPPADAPPPHRMSTSNKLDRLDLSRENLRFVARYYFDAQQYREFREWANEAYPLWDASPTACFLFALAMVYEAELAHESERQTLIDRADQLLCHSRELWRALLDEEDLQGADATLLTSSILLVEQWVLRLRGDAARARQAIRDRLRAITSTTLVDASPELLSELTNCSFYYLLYFAGQDADDQEIGEVLQQMEETVPEWWARDAFEHIIRAVSLRDCFEPVRVHPAWVSLGLTEAVAQPVVPDPAPRTPPQRPRELVPSCEPVETQLMQGHCPAEAETG